MSSPLIHPTAIVDSNAEIADDVRIGPYTIIGPDVVIGEGSIIESHVVIKGPTRIGKNNRIYQFSSVGEDTPDLKYQGEPTRLVIGDGNIIREGVTIHRGTVQDRSETTIGNDNLLMAYVHIGHDSVIGNHCILVNNASLAGHVVVNDWAILGGYTLVHQFCYVGAHAFTGMGCAVGKDIPAYIMVAGAPAAARNINVEGLKRRGFSKEQIADLTKAFKLIYRRGLTKEAAIEEINTMSSASQEFMQTLLASLEASQRGIVR
ncbi:acyl-ACP--UDP-N-acetylglucosamine O-acyltransferase [Teredinibacter sp. KSP-S5-2]|uniref:acyl-ACP--UDP-N-acetylglucosamine O-acyltransferase n=1 Tax=Teredinibacter sp. KSP-S5-2 TaxID=3034506 RepID=UPI00293424AF|nr:acyl-ACP--UDP-N-acetylglucosamine O-acyltransferase [Teredinibacter sp. KSP-S5-2]WNO09835.1 acyl-ACP--UDP-N-acetylglucosamine O-acyltransferase [Teredinibacter sp. KSP-S5-2]